MRRAPKVIISCAVTGSVHTPSLSPFLPVAPEEIASQSVAAVRAGASVLHLHARDPLTGRASGDPAVFEQFVPDITAATDAIINISTGGSVEMAAEERLAAALHLVPEVASLNLGSMNFVFDGLAARVDRWLHAWEEPYLRGSRGRVFANTFEQIERTLREVGGLGTRFEFECYDIGHLYTLAHFADRGLATPPFLVQAVLGVLGGMGADVDNLAHVVHTADKLFGDDYQLSAFGVGRHQVDILTATVRAGGHVRVGLEDSLYLEKGRLAASNAEQVERAVGLVRELGAEVATPDEARAMLGLTGQVTAEAARA